MEMDMYTYRRFDLGFLGCLALVLVGCGSADSAGAPAAHPGGGGSGAGGSGAGGAGAAATGMSDGTGVAGAPTVAVVVVKTNCSALPQPGTWENISPPQFLDPSNMETLAVAVNPVDHTVFAAAGNKTNGGNSGTGVYRSADCGATWVHVSTGAGSDQLNTGDPWAMRIDSSAPQTIYIDNGYGSPPTLFKTTDGGVSWAELSPDTDNVVGQHNFVQAIAIDPANSQHLAVTFHDDCNAPYAKMCLSRTNDAGATWQEFNGPTQVSGWREGASLTILGPTSYFLTCDVGGFFSTDEGKNWKQVFMMGIFGSYGGGVHTGPDGTLYLGVTSNGIWSSQASAGEPAGSKWAQIPNSPNTSVLIDDGTNLIATYSADSSGQPFYSAPLSDLGTWTHMQSVSIVRGSNMFAFDSNHHVVYSANWGAGLWRLVTQ